MGGRHPVGKFVYVLFVCAAAVAYCVRQCVSAESAWRKSGAEWLIVLTVGLLLVQMTPLPSSFLAWAAPDMVELLPLWQNDPQAPVQLGHWRTLSLAPRETRAGLVLFLAHSLVFLTVLQRLNTRQDVERFLRWLAVACAGMATLGLLQYFASNSKFLWVYAHPSRTTDDAVKGVFHNQNHFASYLALGVGSLIWLTWRQFEQHRTTRPPRRHQAPLDWRRSTLPLLLMAALAGVGFAGLLTFSRGGVVALLTATTACVAIYTWKKLLGFRSVVGLIVVGFAAAAAISAYGHESLMRRLGTLHESESLDDLSHARVVLWNAMLQAARSYPVFGAGVGSHVEVYPTYMKEYVRVQFSHGENGYLQVLLETGAVGLALLLTGIGLSLYWCLRTVLRGDSETAACAAAILSGLIASAVHSAGDFVWYIPGCMSVTVILIACACRLHQLTRSDVDNAAAPTIGTPRWVSLGATSIVVALSLAMIKDRYAPALAGPHWDRYIALSLRTSGKSIWASPEERIAADSEGLTQRLMEHLEAALARDPFNARANYRMAVMCLRMFDIRQKNSPNAMDLTQIRDAALASNFPSREEQDRWLDNAIGENRQYLDRAAVCFRRALRLCPLQGEAYIHLAEIAFLDGLGHRAKHAYIDQAERLRPYEGVVLMAAGQEAALEGDLEKALAYWKRAFHQDPASQQRVIKMLAGGVSATQFLELMDPDLYGLATTFQHYRELNRREDAQTVGRKYVATLEEQIQGQSGPAVAQRWFSASEIYRYLEDPAKAVECMERAVRAAPGDVTMRRALALRLLDAQRPDEAADHFRWCLRYDPDDPAAQAGLARALRERLAPAVTGQRQGRSELR